MFDYLLYTFIYIILYKIHTCLSTISNKNEFLQVYHLIVFGYLPLGGTGELVALRDTRGCSGIVNLLSVDFHGGLLVCGQFSVWVFLLRACTGILYIRMGRASGESK